MSARDEWKKRNFGRATGIIPIVQSGPSGPSDKAEADKLKLQFPLDNPELSDALKRVANFAFVREARLLARARELGATVYRIQDEITIEPPAKPGPEWAELVREFMSTSWRDGGR